MEEKLLYITIALPAEAAPTSTSEREMAKGILDAALGERGRVVEISDERQVETIAQVITAFDELKRGQADLQRHLGEISACIPDMNAAFLGVAKAVQLLRPTQSN